MFENSRNLLDRTLKELNVVVFIITIFSQLITGGYMIYLAVLGSGTPWLNIVMASVCFAYLVLAAVHFASESGERRRKMAEAKDVFKRIKLTVKTVMLAISVYGIYLADKNMSAIAIILATLSILMWILEVLFEIVYSYVKIRGAQFIEAIKEDVKPANLAQGAVKLVKEKAREIAENADAVFDTVGEKIVDAGAWVAKTAVHKFNPFRRNRNKKPEIESKAAPQLEEKYETK